MLTAITHRSLWLARIASVTSFVAYLLSHAYILSLPGPDPSRPYAHDDLFVISFFIYSVLLNFVWLSRLFFTWDIVGDTLPLSFGWDEKRECGKLSIEQPLPRSLSIVDVESDDRVFSASLSSAQVRCLPCNIAGNILLTAWTCAWLRDEYLISQILLACNLGVQLYAVSTLLHVDEDDTITPLNYLTHRVMKTGAGIAVLYFMKIWSVSHFYQPMPAPSTAEMLNFAVIFVLMTVGSGPDPTLGLCLLWDLTALLWDNCSNKLWHGTFYGTMLAVSMSLLVDFALSKSESFSPPQGADSSFPFDSESGGQVALEKDVDLFVTCKNVYYAASTA